LGTVKRQTEEIEIESKVLWLPTSKKGIGRVRRCTNPADGDDTNLCMALFRHVVALL